MRRVVISGLGCVTPCGTGAAEMWKALLEGRSGIDRVSSFDVTGCNSQVAGEVRDFRPEDFLAEREIRAFSRYLHLGVAAARMAWDDAGRTTTRLDRDRVGVCMGTAVHAAARMTDDAVTFFERGLGRVHPMYPLQYPGSMPSEIAIALGLTGPAYAVSTACTAAADAIGMACAQIASGMLDAAIAGGSDAPLYPLLFAAFDRLGALSTLNDPPARASRPFSRDRRGFVVSEGAAALVLEAEDVARERGARIYAELAGYGATTDAHHHLAPSPSGVQAERAITLALRAAGVGPDAIDYVNAHGTSTPKNDEIETAVMKRVLGERSRAVPISSTKSMLGHLIGASGAVEALICALAIRDHVVPPTINLTEPDPLCDLDYVAEGARRVPVRTALSTSFGFGSRNAALVLTHAS